MPPAISETEFLEALGELGFRVVRPGDEDFRVWGLIDIGDGVLVDRWRGGSTLASQLEYLKRQKAGASVAPPPATKGAKKNGKQTKNHA